MKTARMLLSFVLMFCFMTPAYAAAPVKEKSPVNLEHLDFLNEDVTIDGKDMLITHIYSEYPDYKWVDASGEGIACVDDVARAAVVYLNDYEQNKNAQSLESAKKALNFVMHMQADDGEFYNFVNKDLSINTDGPTSKKSFDWWAARAMWSLGQGYGVFKDVDPAYAKELKDSFLLANKALQKKVNEHYGEYKNVHGYKIPAWIGGFDAMSNALLGLAEFYEVEPRADVKDSMKKVGRGLDEFQYGSYTQYPYGAHMDWEGSPTLWHAYGSGQTYALAKAGMVLGEKKWIASAKQEAEQFFTHLLVTGMIKEMAPTMAKDEQIAYGVNMLTQGFAEVYHATKDPKYAKYAGLTASWFTGNNDAGAVMYDPATGRGYDGLNGVNGKVNWNSGAESTIEALMAMQTVNEIPLAAKLLDAKTVDRHTAVVEEAESFESVLGKPEIVTPESSWTGDASYSGKLMKLGNQDEVSKKIAIDKSGAYLLSSALVREAGNTGELEAKIDGRTVTAASVKPSPDSDFLTLVNFDRPFYLNKGTHDLQVSFEGRSVLADNLVLQPVVESAVFKSSGQTLKLERNLLTGINYLK
ncbi:hypothetical protein LCY76_20940 [Fictibacillus sp. KIGAM418]|uniref:Uncharacterized protein n=1 Tax=Fictibacillus marinisediminis TaxID=2878389 RepID=A0A9X1XE64_9BACL|nr:hypothetical protein [Fictibacillus marinisediminis]MCK6259041.1 hypothetical protein [Fictibacillus marinisediminis]